MAAESDSDFERIAAVLQQLPESAGMLVWCNSKGIREKLACCLKEAGLEAEKLVFGKQLPEKFRCLLCSPDKNTQRFPFSRWTRDAFLFRRNGDKVIELIPSALPAPDDESWGRELLENIKLKGGSRFMRSGGRIPVAGGNILFDDDFIMVGGWQFSPFYRQGRQRVARRKVRPWWQFSSKARSAFRPTISRKVRPWRQFISSYPPGRRAAAVSRLLKLFNSNGTCNFSRVIVIGEKDKNHIEKLPHIDLYISLTGCKTDGKYVVLVGKCEPVTKPDETLKAQIEGMNRYLDAVATNLVGKFGFCVLRNPLPVMKKNGLPAYLCSLNNCLTELAGNSKCVWLPSIRYRQEEPKLIEFEGQNKEIWKALGFEVSFIEADFHSVMDELGALHCITNEMLREPPDGLPATEIPADTLKKWIQQIHN